jgi:general nucleoside transport system ATP-binding protein
MAGDTIVEMQGITKRFPGVVANRQVDLNIARCEIHVLLGENGAGKTTLMNLLYGLYQPDEGMISLRGRPVTLSSPRQAIDLGIGMVHQHFMLVPVLSVAENVILGLPAGKGPFLDLASVSAHLRALAQQSGLDVDPQALVWQLPVGVQQRVEILKFLYRGAEILILDEPTAVLTPDEVLHFFEVVRSLKRQGATIILITHKLNEVMAISDRVTVMRDGTAITTLRTSDTSQAELARLMVGREVLFQAVRPPANPGHPVLEVNSLHVLDDRNLPALKGVSFSVREGEILGLAGVSGNGQQELAEVLAGVRHVKSGRIAVCGQDLTGREPRAFIDAGVAQVPSDRREMGTVLDFSVAENAVLSTIADPPYARRGVVRWDKVRAFGARLIKDYGIKCPGPDSPASVLSGGNLQKLVLAREISGAPRLLVAVQPTRGLDVAAIEYVHARLIEERARGAAILLISTDLDEIMALSDRIAIMYEGELAGIVPAEGADVQEIALMMAGVARRPENRSA